jgi:hypothetical protein
MLSNSSYASARASYAFDAVLMVLIAPPLTVRGTVPI